jgi:hypothetical protein
MEDPDFVQELYVHFGLLFAPQDLVLYEVEGFLCFAKFLIRVAKFLIRVAKFLVCFAKFLIRVLQKFLKKS